MKKVIVLMLAILFLVSGLAFAGQKDKVAVAAKDKIPGASVSGTVGTSRFFLFFDEKGKLIEPIANPCKEAQNPGSAVADFLASKGVTIIVATVFGDRIVQLMKSKGIRTVVFQGSVEEAVKKVLQPK